MEQTRNSGEARPLLEQHLHDFLELNPDTLGLGPCKILGREYVIDSGRIDLLVETTTDQLYAVELKIGIAGRDAIAQIASYVSAIKEEFPDRDVFGLLVAAEFDKGARLAYQAVRNIGLKKFQLEFNLINSNDPILDFRPPLSPRPLDKRVSAKPIADQFGIIRAECPQCTRVNIYTVGGVNRKCSVCGCFLFLGY